MGKNPRLLFLNLIWQKDGETITLPLSLASLTQLVRLCFQQEHCLILWFSSLKRIGLYKKTLKILSDWDWCRMQHPLTQLGPGDTAQQMWPCCECLHSGPGHVVVVVDTRRFIGKVLWKKMPGWFFLQILVPPHPLSYPMCVKSSETSKFKRYRLCGI